MNCDYDLLAQYLDGELADNARCQLLSHLRDCPVCRRELGRLRFLWLELNNPVEIAPPAELSYLRQQAVRAALAHETAGLTFWESQRLAWTPVLLAAGFLADSGLLNTMAKTAGYGLRISLQGLGRLGMQLVKGRGK